MSFEKEWNKLAKRIFTNAVNHGFWQGGKDGRNDGEAMALIHSEISEALEAMRSDNPTSSKILEFSSVEEELADAVIRIMDYCFGKDLDIAGAILAKIEYNYSRDYMHGKTF
jgi:NTP pyrophosphatase (non-canonical NTP hydrolase)|tara:strand:+ start:1513 stop:1848 length:336 start_codon:yes stop_codon:yes gene_type:complete